MPSRRRWLFGEPDLAAPPLPAEAVEGEEGRRLQDGGGGFVGARIWPRPNSPGSGTGSQRCPHPMEATTADPAATPLPAAATGLGEPRHAWASFWASGPTVFFLFGEG